MAAVLEVAGGMGMSREALLRAIDVTPAMFQGKDGRVPLSAGMGLFRELHRQSGDSTVGLHLSERLHFAAFGVTRYLFRASPTLRSAYERVVRYIPLINDHMEIELEVSGSEAFLRWRLRGLALPMEPQLAEFFAGLLLRTGREATTADWRPSEVRFRHPAIEPRAERERILGAPVRFGRPRYEIVLQASVLDLPLREQDPLLLEVMQPHANALLRRVTPRTTRERVRVVLIDLLPEGRASLEAVAAALASSPRTLQRGLKQEGTSFAAQLDEVKRELAQRHISAGHLEIVEVALITGFSELSAFYRAFRRWTGTTPGEYRRQQGFTG